LSAGLHVLAVPAFLRPLAPEHRSNVIKFDHARLVPELMFDKGANDRGSPFRTQGEGFALVAIRESVHLLGNDIGFFTDSTNEQLGRLKNRGADFTESVGVERLTQSRLEGVPDFDVSWKNVVCAANRLNHERRFRNSDFGIRI